MTLRSPMKMGSPEIMVSMPAGKLYVKVKFNSSSMPLCRERPCFCRQDLCTDCDAKRLREMP